MDVTYYVMEFSIWEMDDEARRKAGMDQFLDFDPVDACAEEDEDHPAAAPPAKGDSEPTATGKTVSASGMTERTIKTSTRMRWTECGNFGSWS